ncbi:hypothetical protein [Chryseobacterium sp. JV274]|uniref:hypothetical protein n=1 Tax=Chryseobacterium sp. JV274 TaxID=1932669 RepID=UPI0015D72937|nr:hypothetical protein [Chryseobacterium sp. JV274]
MNLWFLLQMHFWKSLYLLFLSSRMINITASGATIPFTGDLTALVNIYRGNIIFHAEAD